MFFKKRKKEKDMYSKLLEEFNKLYSNIETLELENKYLESAIIFLSKYSAKDIVFSLHDSGVKVEYFNNTGYKMFVSEDPNIVNAVSIDAIKTINHTDHTATIMVNGDLYIIDKDKQTIKKHEGL